MPLSHSSPDCTGTWGVRTIGGGSCWRCNVCLAVGHPSAANEAASVENAAGKTLEQLTREGRELLEGA